MAAAASHPVSTIAKLLLLTPRRVQQLAKDGHIPRSPGGRYELAPTVQAYIKYLRDRALGGDVADENIGEHKARLIKARADQAVMETERQSGQLIPAAEVKAGWIAIVTMFKQRALAIPTRAAPLVAVEADVSTCHEIIEGLMWEALSELASTKVESSLTTEKKKPDRKKSQKKSPGPRKAAGAG
jgi:hypothetical protein